jgi:hypothetical protein
MDFNFENLKISHNGQYVLAGDAIYDSKTNTTFNINETTLDFWLYFMRDNSELSYKNNILEFSSIQRKIRETMYMISEIFDSQEKTKFIFEFERKFSNKLIVENENKDENVNSIVSSWNYIIESVTNYLDILTEQEKGFFSRAWDKTKELAGKGLQKAKEGIGWLASKGIGWFMEQLRKALFSWGGAAVQALAAGTGVGNIVLVVVWGAMLAWDILQGINGSWNWFNIIIDLIGVITTGPGSKIAFEAFKKLGLVGSKLPLKELITKLMNSSGGAWMGRMLQSIVKGLGTLGKVLLQGIEWVTTKLGFKSFGQYSSSIKNKLNEIVKDISTATQGAKLTPNSLSKAASNVKSAAGATKKAFSALSPNTKRAAGAVGIGAAGYALSDDKRTFSGAFGNENPQSAESDLADTISNQEAEYSIEDMTFDV